MRVDITIAANIRDENKALYVAKAGVNAAIALLKRDNNNYDAPSEDWGKFAELSQNPLVYSEYLGGGHIAGSITDESSKINVNKIVDVNSKSLQQLRGLFGLLEIDADIIDGIMDWIDSDHYSRLMDAEDDYYQGLEKPYPCKDGPLDTISELLMVKGITGDLFYGTRERKGIRGFLTVHSDGKVNINTAGSLVLQTLGYREGDEWVSPISEEMSQGIIDYRTTQVFEKISDLKNVPGMSEIYKKIKGQITVQSGSFSVDVLGEVNKAEKRIRAIINRERAGGGMVMKVAYWAVE
jgi:general secretion pathway protein K